MVFWAGFRLVMGKSPIAGLFPWENQSKKMDGTGGIPHDLGNLQMYSLHSRNNW